MSVHKRNGRWQVKWREAGRQRSRTFTRKGDADTFDREVARRRELGPHLVHELTRQAVTLEAFVRGPWRAHAATLSPASRAKYAWALERHLAELVDEPLVALDVPRLAGQQRLLLDRGASAGTVREALMYLGAILQIAVEHGHLPANPARGLRRVPAEPGDEVRPLAPVELERILQALTGRDRAICLLAGHLGLRPLEARAAPWGAFDGDTLVIGRTRTKRTAARTRTITVPAITAREPRAWQLESGGRGDEPIIGPMSANAMKLWMRRVLRPAAAAATGRDDVTVYTLRHTHASALHYAGFTPPEAAARLGHGLDLHWRTYAHVVEQLRGRRYDGLDALIGAARAELEFPVSSPAAR
jgi:integrase